MTVRGAQPDRRRLAQLLKEAGSALDPDGVAALVAGVLAAPPEVGNSWYALVADPTPPALAEDSTFATAMALKPSPVRDPGGSYAWWDSAAGSLQAAGFAPSHAQESAIMMSLQPGAYTAILSGVGGGTGTGIVAVYRVP